MHWLGLMIVVIIAGVVAMIFLQRLYDAQQRLASLHDELRRNDLKLQNHLTQLEAQRTQPQEHEENLQEEGKP